MSSNYRKAVAAVLLSLGLFSLAGSVQAGKNASLKLDQGMYKMGGAKPCLRPQAADQRPGNQGLCAERHPLQPCGQYP